MNQPVRTIIATVLAGVVGNVVNAVAASILIRPELIDFALVPGRYVVAILVAALIPILRAPPAIDLMTKASTAPSVSLSSPQRSPYARAITRRCSRAH